MSQEDRASMDEIKELMKRREGTDKIVFKKVDWKRLNEVTLTTNGIVKNINKTSISETNNLINATSVSVARQLGLTKPTRGQKNAGSWWKRRIDGDIKCIRKHVNILERVR